jgi:hypothetical protein
MLYFRKLVTDSNILIKNKARDNDTTEIPSMIVVIELGKLGILIEAIEESNTIATMFGILID